MKNNFWSYIFLWFITLGCFTNCKRSQLIEVDCDLQFNTYVQAIHDSIVEKQWSLESTIDTLIALNTIAAFCPSNNSDSLLALANYNLGKQLLHIGEFVNAKKFFQASLGFHKTIPSNLQYNTNIQAVHDSIVSQHWSLNFAIDTILSLNARSTLYPNNSHDSLLALINDNLGKQLLRINRLREARTFFRMALEFYKAIPKNSGRFNILRMHHNIGLAYLREGEPYQALDYLDSADTWLFHKNMNVVFVNTKLRKGQAYLEIGEFNNALNQLYLGLDTLKKHTGLTQKPSLQFQITSSLVSCYRGLHEFSKAIQAANNVLDLSSTNLSKPKSWEMAGLYLDIGSVWQDSLLSDPSNEHIINQSVQFTQMALEFYSENQLERQMAIASGNLGELYRRIKLFPSAEKVLSKAISRLNSYEDRQELCAQLFINRGESYYDQGQFEKALSDYDSSLHFVMPSYKLKTKSTLPPLNSHITNHGDLMVLLSNMAQTYTTIYQQNEEDKAPLVEAQIVYDTLFKLVNKIRGDFISDQAKLELASKSQHALQKAFLTCIQLASMLPDRKTYYEQQAFRIAEQSNAFVLLESTRFNNIITNLPTIKQAQEKKLLQERATIEKEMYALGTNDKRFAELKKDLLKNFDKSRSYQQQLQAEFPDIYAVKYKGVDISIETIQTVLLDQDQALVEYFLHETALYIFLILKNDFQLLKVPIAKSDLEVQVKSFRESLERDEFSDSKSQRQFIENSNLLFKHLLGRVKHMLPRRVIIIPTGILNNLPFEALLYQISEGSLAKQAMEENFVLFKHALSYCFSASLLEEMQSIPIHDISSEGPIVFDCHFNTDLHKNKNDLSYPNSLQKSLPSLRNLGRNQEEEVAAIKKKFPKSRIYPDQLASEKEFLQACQKYPIIHVVTHGALNELDPAFSFISFSQMNMDLDISELFFVKELYAVRNWNLELAFFSACQTASGRYFTGEGVISMASGLAQAGARSFITTYWDVPTDPKARISPDFYERFITNGQPKDVALAEAKRLLAKEDRYSPSDWAGLILIGATN